MSGVLEKEITYTSLVCSRNLKSRVGRRLSRYGKNTSEEQNDCGLLTEQRGLGKRAQTLVKTPVLLLSGRVIWDVKYGLLGFSFLICIIGIIMLVFRVFIEGLT